MSSIPTTLESLFKARLTWLQVHNYAPTTITFDSTVLKKFRTWCETRELSLPQEVTSQTVLAYQRWLHHWCASPAKKQKWQSYGCQLPTSNFGITATVFPMGTPARLPVG